MSGLHKDLVVKIGHKYEHAVVRIYRTILSTGCSVAQYNPPFTQKTYRSRKAGCKAVSLLAGLYDKPDMNKINRSVRYPFLTVALAILS